LDWGAIEHLDLEKIFREVFGGEEGRGEERREGRLRKEKRRGKWEQRIYFKIQGNVERLDPLIGNIALSEVDLDRMYNESERKRKREWEKARWRESVNERKQEGENERERKRGREKARAREKSRGREKARERSERERKWEGEKVRGRESEREKARGRETGREKNECRKKITLLITKFSVCEICYSRFYKSISRIPNDNRIPPFPVRNSGFKNFANEWRVSIKII
jgi:hypothetical protein